MFGRNNSAKVVVTILMSVYNGEKYLHEAVESILNQTFSGFEFLIIDDASKDGTPEILHEYAEKDQRIRVETNAENLGLTTSLNKGLRLARGEYVARMDADDISDPTRLEKQIKYMQNHPEIGLLGTAYHSIDEKGNYIRTNYPETSDTAIRWRMLFRNAFIHTSIIIRREILTKNSLFYCDKLPYSQDMDLWVELMDYVKAANLREPLVYLRRHDNSISARHLKKQEFIATKISYRQLSTLVPDSTLSFKEVQVLREWHREFPKQLEKEQFYLCHNYLNIFNNFSKKNNPNQIMINCIRCRLLLKIMRAIPLRIIKSLKLTPYILKPILGTNFPFFLAGFIRCSLFFFQKVMRFNPYRLNRAGFKKF